MFRFLSASLYALQDLYFGLPSVVMLAHVTQGAGVRIYGSRFDISFQLLDNDLKPHLICAAGNFWARYICLMNFSLLIVVCASRCASRFRKHIGVIYRLAYFTSEQPFRAGRVLLRTARLYSLIYLINKIKNILEGAPHIAFTFCVLSDDCYRPAA